MSQKSVHGLRSDSPDSLARLVVSRAFPAGLTLSKKFTHKSVTKSLADMRCRFAYAVIPRLTDGGMVKDVTFLRSRRSVGTCTYTYSTGWSLIEKLLAFLLDIMKNKLLRFLLEIRDPRYWG